MLSPWTSSRPLPDTVQELTVKDFEMGTKEYEQEAAGEDGLGFVAAGEGWDDAIDGAGLEDEDGLEGDAIDDWY